LFTRRTPARRDPRATVEPDLAGTVLVSRQPVLDRELGIAGYKIAYALPGGAEPVTAEPASLFDTVLSDIGLHELVGDCVAHLPITRELLVALGAPPGRPDRLVLRIAHADTSDPVLALMLELAVERGYALELHALTGPDVDPELLDLFKFVEVDATAWGADEIERLMPALQNRGCVPMAAGVRSHVERDRLQRLGFELFTGPFYGSPNFVPGRKLPTGDLRRVASIVSLQPSDTTLERVVEVIEQDLGLSVKLLRYLNSAYFGLAATVGTVRDAAIRLGSRGVARWALTITIAGAPRLSPDLALLALTRARLCELLGAGDPALDSGELFTIGLLSAADAVFDSPLEDILAELPLTERVTEALLARRGPAGEIVRAAVAYERGDFNDPLLIRLGTGHGASYKSALGWAIDTLPDPE
jgi:EAL and modified HD-GYP domain-containing signal transduction protein